LLINFVIKVVPGEDKHEEFELQYLDKRILETPTVAVVQIIKSSDHAVDELKLITEKVDGALSNALEALRTEQPRLVQLVDYYENTVDDIRSQFKASHIKHLNEGDCNISAGVLFLDLITNLERVSDHSVNIADIVRPEVSKMKGVVD
jgi:phosphate:Na+ symporter